MDLEIKLESTICRTCACDLSNNATTISINESKEAVSFKEMLLSITSIKVSNITKNSPNSSFICLECSIKLYDSYIFRLKCIQTDQLFHQLSEDNKLSLKLRDTSPLEPIANDTDSTENPENRVSKAHNKQKKSYTCLVCHKQFAIHSTLSRHRKKYDHYTAYERVRTETRFDALLNENEFFSCNKCSKCFRTRYRFLRHMRSSHKKYCLKTRNDLANKNVIPVKLEDRICDNTDNKPKPPTPSKNDDEKEFKRQIALDTKVETVFSPLLSPKVENDSGSDDLSAKKAIKPVKNYLQSYQCVICESVFDTPSKLRMHIAKTKHYSASWLARIRKRKRKDDSLTKKQWICSKCGKVLKNKVGLKIHQLMHQDPSLQCTMCPKKFRRKELLDIHLRRHTGEQVATCQYCGKQFVAQKFLSEHIRVHRPKEYYCDLCDRAFTLKSTLVNHRRTHTGERPYKCDICNKTFNRAHILKAHKLVHSDERPFSCHLCSHTFKTKHSLQIHQGKHC